MVRCLHGIFKVCLSVLTVTATIDEHCTAWLLSFAAAHPAQWILK
jgi:hypothetical protein